MNNVINIMVLRNVIINCIANNTKENNLFPKFISPGKAKHHPVSKTVFNVQTHNTLLKKLLHKN